MVDKIGMQAEISADASKYVKEINESADATNKLTGAADEASTSVSTLEGQLGKTAGVAAEQGSRVERAASSTAGFAATRYALYDVATSWGVISAATLGAAVAVEKVGADYEYAFSSVRRVTQTAGEEAAALKSDLKGLASTIHEEFESISQVATLGGQMGIANDEITEFSKNVTMFGATTDATIQQASVGFGRIAQLTKAGADSWDSIGSAIYQVGITSVATETQILNVAQEIATAGNLAGFTTDEVIGLAGALASLGVQPERARGNILRVFSEIDKSVANGGESLQNFARISGMSAQQFADSWSRTPEATFRALLEGLNSAQEAGANLGQEIRNLGIVAVRDVQTIQQLANNTEVYTQAMQESHSAYRDGSALLDAYGVRSDTVVGKLQILNNVVRNIMDSMSNTSAIKVFLDQFIKVGHLVEGLVEIPLVGWFASAGVVLLGYVGIMAATRAGMAAMRASFLALQLAMHNMAKMGGTVDLSFRGMLATMAAFNRGNVQVAATSEAAAVALNTEAGAATRLTGAMGTATTASRALMGSLRTNVAFAAISLAIWGIASAVNHFKEQAERAENTAREMFGSFSELGAAIARDTATYEESGEYMRLLGVNTEDNIIIWDSASLSQEELAKKLRDTNEAAGEQVVALGEAAEAAMLDSILESEDFEETWASISAAAKTAGVDIQTVVEEIKTGGASGLFDQLRAASEADLEIIKSEISEIESELANARNEASAAAMHGNQAEAESILALVEAKQLELEAAQQKEAATQAEVASYSRLSDASRGFLTITEKQIAKQAAQNEFTQQWAGDLEDAADALDEISEATSNWMSELEQAHKAEAQMESLIHTILENGTAIDDMTAEGRASFEALSSTISMFSAQAGDDTYAFALNLVDMFAYAEGAGIQFGDEVDYLRAQMVAAFNQQWGLSLDISDAQGSIRTFIQEAINAIRVRAEIEREMITRVQSSGLDNWAAATGVDYRGEQLKYHQDNLRVLNQQVATLENLKSSLSEVEDRGRKTADTFYNPPGRRNSGGSGGPIGKDAKDAAKEVRTLTDYIKDLSSVAKNAFDFRFGMIVATDDLEAAKRALTEMREDALQRVVDAFEGLDSAKQKVTDLRISLQDLNATMTGLQADRSKLEYFYSIAVEYGDTARAEQIMAQLAKVNADMSKTENDRTKTSKELTSAQKDVTEAAKELKQAQDDSKRTLEGNTKSAADQRKAVMDLVAAYQTQITELANSGASQDEVKRKTEQLRKEFEKELTQLGYNRGEVKRYSDAFKDLSTVIKNIPGPTVKPPSMNPATRAIDDWIRATAKKTVTVKTKATTPKLGTVTGGPYQPSSIYSRGSASVSKIEARAGSRVVISGGGGPGAGIMQMRDVGGFTGAGGQYTPKGVFHGGEYIFPKKDVNQGTGLPHADVLARMLVGTRDFSSMMSGMSVSNNNGAMYISGMSPGLVQVLAQAMRTTFVLGGKEIASATNSANSASTTFGSN